MRIVYATSKGGKPMRVGMNQAKRIARSADRRDQLTVLREIGPGHPRQHQHHQRLVRQRHAYYRDCYDEEQRIRLAASLAGNPGADAAGAGDAKPAVSEPPTGAAAE